MKKLIIISVLLAFTNFAIGQDKKSAISINFGVHQTNSYKKLVYYYTCTEGCYPTQQKSATSFDFNILYTRKTKNPKLNVIFGIGLNQKGLDGLGMWDNGAGDYSPEKYNFRNTYIGLYGGVGYSLLNSQKTNISLGQLLSPEIVTQNYENYKKIALATRTNLTITYKLINNLSLVLTPYFQTAITKYNKTRLLVSSDYIPFGYGINFGVSF
ncbi:MAG: hypothetical protein MUC49_01550 [Raineya sp.]|jgi:hypothetical protein|nr:hypothetical protein [Raineya sp.]